MSQAEQMLNMNPAAFLQPKQSETTFTPIIKGQSMNQVPKVINYFIIFEDSELLSDHKPLDCGLKPVQAPAKKRAIKVEHDHNTAQH
jgi:hypothetical protein